MEAMAPCEIIPSIHGNRIFPNLREFKALILGESLSFPCFFWGGHLGTHPPERDAPAPVLGLGTLGPRASPVGNSRFPTCCTGFLSSPGILGIKPKLQGNGGVSSLQRFPHF